MVAAYTGTELKLRWNLYTGEQELILDGDLGEALRFEAPNDPVYADAVELLNKGRDKEARKKYGYKLMVRCLANRWYAFMDYCEKCIARRACKITSPFALKWLLSEAYIQRVNGKHSLLTEAAANIQELARYNPRVERALKWALQEALREARSREQ